VTLVEPREIGYLRSFECAVGQKIHLEQLPSLDDVRCKRRNQTRAIVEQALAGEDSTAFRTMVAELSHPRSQGESRHRSPSATPVITAHVDP
jgi:hypothetical protein